MFEHEDLEEFKKRVDLATSRRKIFLSQKNLKCIIIIHSIN